MNENEPSGAVRRLLLSALLLAGVLPALPAAAQEPLTLHAYRFWRPPDNTLVEAYAVIPLGLLSFQSTGDGERAAFAASFEVRDQDGNVLSRQEWTDTAVIPPLTTGRMRASTTEHFTFQVKPGTYTLALELRDAATDRPWSAEYQLQAYATPPRASDLVLGGELVRLDDEGAEPAAADAIVRGNLAVVPNHAGVLSMNRSSVALYAEVYRVGEEAADSAEVWIDLNGVNRSFTYRTPAQLRVYPAGLGSEAFALDLAGLPPGEYRMALNIAVDDEPLVLEQPLQMLPPGAGEIELASTLPYPGATNEQLDSIFAPMELIAGQGEVHTFENLTSADAKRRFIARFWEQRAAGAGMTYDQILQDWQSRVAYANVHFRPQAPGTRIRSGWQTDRGRIYVKYGPPNERYTSGQMSGGSDIKACEAWQYSGGRGDRYVFWDRTGFGDFELAYSTDRDEPGIPGTEQMYSRSGVLRCEP